MALSAQTLFMLFGDIPKDSPAGEKLKAFVTMLVMDARTGGAVGSLFKSVVHAGCSPDDPIYSKLSPQDRAAAMSVLNAVRGAIDA